MPLEPYYHETDLWTVAISGAGAKKWLEYNGMKAIVISGLGSKRDAEIACKVLTELGHNWDSAATDTLAWCEEHQLAWRMRQVCEHLQW